MKKKDSLCFDISNLEDDKKRNFAKNLKKTVDDFNAKLESENPDEEANSDE